MAEVSTMFLTKNLLIALSLGMALAVDAHLVIEIEWGKILN